MADPSSPLSMGDDGDRQPMLHSGGDDAGLQRNGNGPVGAHISRTASSGVFSVASLCSPDNSGVSTPLSTATRSPDKNVNTQREMNGSSSSSSNINNGAANGSQGEVATSRVESTDAAGDNDEADAESVVAVGGQPEGDEEGEDEDDEEGEGEGEGDEDEEDEEDDDEEDDDEDDEDDDEDDDDGDDVSTASHEAPAKEEAADGSQPSAKVDADGDADMVSAPAEGAASNGDSTAAATPLAAAPNVLTVKKKQKRKQREPSVDVSLPKGPPPLPTVRFQIKVSTENYMVNVPEKLHKKLKQDNHPWAEWYESREAGPSNSGGAAASSSAKPGGAGSPPAEAESLGDLGPFAHLLNKYPVGETGDKPKRRKKRRKDVEEYDVNDPFVDDSELHVDEPTHSAKPISKGFYVAAGDIELEKLQKKRAGAKAADGGSPNGPIASGSGSGGAAGGMAGVGIGGAGAPPSYLINGTQLEVSNRMLQLRAEEKGLTDTPSLPPESLAPDAIGLVDASAQTKAAGSRDSPIKVDDEPANKKKNYPTKPVDRRLAAEFQHIKNLVASEDFSVKHKFPVTLRPPLRKAARVALELGEYNENFFNYLPAIFPYNRFTMSKLVKREFYDDHAELLKRKQDELLDDLREAVQEALPAHRADYEEQMQRWREQGAVSGPGATAGAAGSPTNGTTTPAMEGEAAAEGGDDEAAAASKSGGDSAPVRKWRWTERMREDVFQIILLENGLTELRQEKGRLENVTDQISELNQRKAAYKRMMECWPSEAGGEEWTTTTAISREFSLTKKKHDRQNHAMVEAMQSG